MQISYTYIVRSYKYRCLRVLVRIIEYMCSKINQKLPVTNFKKEINQNARKEIFEQFVT